MYLFGHLLSTICSAWPQLHSRAALFRSVFLHCSSSAVSCCSGGGVELASAIGGYHLSLITRP